MERAARLIGTLKLGRQGVSTEDLVAAAWPLAVGKRLAMHTEVRGMVRSSLVVEVEDGLWQKNLFGLRRQILANLDRIIGCGIVEEVQFRVRGTAAIPRREPQRAERTRTADEAGGIEDPVLRRLYVAAKKKASA